MASRWGVHEYATGKHRISSYSRIRGRPCTQSWERPPRRSMGTNMGNAHIAKTTSRRSLMSDASLLRSVSALWFRN